MAILLTVTICLVILWWTCPPAQARLSPDGQYYQRDTLDRPMPYCLRWALPMVLWGRSLRFWYYQSVVATAIIGLLAGWLAEFHGFNGWIASGLVMALPIVRTSWKLPVLTDLSGLAIMMAALCLGSSELDWFPLKLVVGAFGEKAPVFTALQSGDWTWLLGLLFCLPGWFDRRPIRQSDPDWLRTPFQLARKESRFNLAQLALPWGPLLLGLLSPNWNWTDTAILVVAYAQLGWAQDSARVYMWAFPTLLLRSLDVIRPEWGPALVVVAWLSPYRFVL